MLIVQNDSGKILVWQDGTLLLEGATREAALEFIEQRFGLVPQLAREFLEYEIVRLSELI